MERQNEIDHFSVTEHVSALVHFDGGAWHAEWQTRPYLKHDHDHMVDQDLAERAAACRSFLVTGSVTKSVAKGPSPPLTTSALRQAAGSTLGYSPALTQLLAQSADRRETYHAVIADLDHRLDAELKRLAAINPAYRCPASGKALRLGGTTRSGRPNPRSDFRIEKVDVEADMQHPVCGAGAFEKVWVTLATPCSSMARTS